MFYNERGIEEGLAIFSKFEINSISAYPLAPEFPSSDINKRWAFHARIDISERNCSFSSFHFLVTHFTFDSQAQQVEAQAVWNYSESLSLPQVLVGDFNIRPQDESNLFPLESEPKNEFEDAWIEKYPSLPGFTWCNLQLSTRDKGKACEGPASERIDGILIKGEHKILETSVFGQQPVQGVFGSDHRAIAADILFLKPKDSI
jgi:endonuclease/exonuclease/phosphatase family metal-dependent hydrolase